MPINKAAVSDFRGLQDSRPSLLDRGTATEAKGKAEENKPPLVSPNVSVDVYSSDLLGLDLDGARKAYHPNNEGIDRNGNGGINKEEARKNEFRGKRGYGIAKYRPPGTDFNRAYLQSNGFYVSQTAIGFRHLSESNPEKWVDAVSVPYLRVNRHFHRAGIRKGDIAYIINHSNGLSSYALFADVKFDNDVVEMSLALARKLEIPVIIANEPSYDRRKIVTKYVGIKNRPVTVYSFKNSGDGNAKTIEQINTLGEFLKNKLLFKDGQPGPLNKNERIV